MNTSFSTLEQDTRFVSETLMSKANQELLSKLMNSPDLSLRDKVVLRLKYGVVDGIPHSFAEIAEVLNISRQRVKQIHDAVKAKAVRLVKQQ